VKCDRCGEYEIGPKLSEELVDLPENHWALDRIRSGFTATSAPRVVWKPFNNIPEVGPLGSDTPNKHMKSFLRAKAEGRLQGGGVVYRTTGDEDEAT
jgi:hypothetical protein